MERNIWMSNEEYNLVTDKTPIPTVDLVILRKVEENWETLLLVRKTGYEAGKWCIIGGRLWKGETLEGAIKRHVGDLGIEVEVIAPFTYNTPAWVNDHLDQDKTKQSLCSVYPVRVKEGNLKEEGEEYKSYRWFSVTDLPELAYDHKFEVSKTIEQLKKVGIISE